MIRQAKLNMYPGVTIHDCGLVTRDSDGKELGSLNNNGYVTLTLTRSDGHRCAIGRNRLVAMAFCPCPGEFSDFVVNHKDTNRQNDHYDNLEWMTQKENIAYSGKLNPNHPKYKAIQVRNFDTKEVTRFDCMIDAARKLGLHKDLVQNRAKANGAFIYEDRNQFRLDQGDTPWNENPKGTFVLVKDIVTGEVQRFYRSYEAAELIGVSQAALSISLNKDNQPLLKARYLAKYEHSLEDWRSVENAVIDDSVRRGTRVVVIRNPEKGIEKMFSTGKECAEYLGIGPTTLNMRLRSGNPNKIYADGFQVSYLSPTRP